MYWLFVVPLVIAALAAVGAGSRLGSMKQRFQSLGTIAGKSLVEIEAAVGPANSFSGLAGGKKLFQWQHTSQAGSYHIALRFDENEICEGVTHEFSS